MKKFIQLQVPRPCHENWNKMTETDKGRFCSSCRKEVVDFSLMSDKQILEYISKSHNHICGRFTEPQLNRDMIINKERKLTWLKYFMHVIIPALLISNKSSAQQIKITDSITCTQPKLFNDEVIVGTVGGLMIQEKNKHQPILINGKVTDESGETLAGATIMIKGTKRGTVTDQNGNFQLSIPGKSKQVTLVSSYVGYDAKEIQLDLGKVPSGVININMLMSAHATTGLTYVVVGRAIAKKSIKTDTLQSVKNFISNIINNDTVKIYPNPVHTGSTFNIDFNVKDAGEYNIEVVNISGQPVMQKKIYLNSKQHIEQITCDSHIMQGIYFVQVVNTGNKKVYTNKMLVQ
jgi:carboxypeptidase-like protein/type IX secretion system substrate protein